MSLREYTRRRFALSENGYRNLRRSTAFCILYDISMIVPVMILFMLVCDVMGDNRFDYGLEPWHYLVMCVVSVVFMTATYRLQYDSTYFTTYKESTQVRIGLAEKLRLLPLSYFGQKDPTDLTTRIMGDVTMQESAMTHWFPQLIGAMIYTAAMGVLIVLFSPVMGVAALWPVPIAFAIVLGSRRVQSGFTRRKMERVLSVTEGVQECLENMRDLRANDAGGRYLDGLFAKMDGVESAEIKGEFASAAFVVSAQLILKFGIVTTAIAGGYLLVQGSIDLVVFIVFLILISRLYDPMNMSLQNIAAMISAEYNMERLQEIEDQPVQTGSTEFHPDGYDIVFDHVRFSYDDRTEVLRDVSFTARQGEVTALIGPSGEGKTTAAKLAARFWDLDGGRITVGGVDVSGIDPETLLSCYSIVFHRRGGHGGGQTGSV